MQKDDKRFVQPFIPIKQLHLHFLVLGHRVSQHALIVQIVIVNSKYPPPFKVQKQEYGSKQ